MFAFLLYDKDGNSLEYEVKFYYPDHKKKYKNRRITACKIFLGEKLICTGYATRNEVDKYVKPVGRKIALTHALRNFLSKEDRTIIWGAFFKKFKRMF